LIRYRAAWVLPIDRAPLRDGWVDVDDGRIAALGHGGARPQRARRDVNEVDLGTVAVLPGLVNAHTHLELSYLAGQVPPSATFVEWIRNVMAARREQPDPCSAEIVHAAGVAIQDAVAYGTAVVGDISNTLISCALLTGSPLAAAVFYELLGFNPASADGDVERASGRLESLPRTDRLRAHLAAHAPYSVAPSLFAALRRELDRDPQARASVHIAESREEVEFVRSAGGPWRALLEELGVWTPSFAAPEVSPVEYLDRVGFLDERVLAVHAVQASAADLSRLAARKATLVACPRSNRHTGAGVPPIERFYAAGVRVAVGTDSLASCPDLNVFEELAAMRAVAPGVPAAALLASATREGARALGFETDYGTLAPGKRARLIAVDVPDPLSDVEEYLLSGIRPEQIRWLG
jgi:cytosine/adenosine deaminase-related metal-dependent hydrolase